MGDFQVIRDRFQRIGVHKVRIGFVKVSKLRQNLYNKSWTVTNCAEVDAFNQGMDKMKGSKIEHFESYTIKVNNSMGKSACANSSI